MRYLNISKEELCHYMPATIQFFEGMDEIWRKKGIEVNIRDTDHTYDSLRISVVGDDKEECDFVRQKISVFHPPSTGPDS